MDGAWWGESACPWAETRNYMHGPLHVTNLRTNVQIQQQDHFYLLPPAWAPAIHHYHHPDHHQQQHQQQHQPHHHQWQYEQQQKQQQLRTTTSSPMLAPPTTIPASGSLLVSSIVAVKDPGVLFQIPDGNGSAVEVFSTFEIWAPVRKFRQRIHLDSRHAPLNQRMTFELLNPKLAFQRFRRPPVGRCYFLIESLLLFKLPKHFAHHSPCCF